MMRQRKSVRRSNRKGFTLVEMMIALVIIMVGLLGLVQATLLAIDSNMRNLFRDEAVRISEQAMTGELVDKNDIKHEGLKNLPVSDDAYPNGLQQGVWAPPLGLFIVERTFGGVTKPYTVYISVTNLGDSRKKSLQVIVGWDHKKETPLKPETNREFQHSITSIVVSAL